MIVSTNPETKNITGKTVDNSDLFNERHGYGRILSTHTNAVGGETWFRVQFKTGIWSVAKSQCVVRE